MGGNRHCTNLVQYQKRIMIIIQRAIRFILHPSTGSRAILWRSPFRALLRIMLGLRERLAATVSRTTIEPIVFFNFLALSFFYVSQHAVLYRSICVQNYGQYDKRIDCSDLRKNGPELEDRVQRDASIWNMILSLCYLLPAVVSDMILGAWSDRHGRKVNILIGLTGLIVASVASIGLAIFPLMSLYVLCAAKVFAGLCGYIAIVMISSWAYLTDVVENKQELTSRMMSVQVYRFIADVVGSFSFSWISQITSLAVTLLLAEFFFVVAFFYALARLYQMPPSELRKFSLMEKEKRQQRSLAANLPKYGSDEMAAPKAAKLAESSMPLGPNGSIPVSPAAGPLATPRTDEDNLDYMWHLYKGVWLTLTRKRPRNERTYLLLCSAIYFVFMMSEIGLQGSILSLYVFHRPFFWSPSTLGQFKGFQNSCALIVNLFGAVLLNEFVHVDDTSIMLLGLGSGICHLTLTGLASDTWTMYSAGALASFGSLLVPALKSFMVRTVGEDEVGKALAANGIAADLAFVASALVFTNMYTFTVSTCAGVVFFVGGGLLTLCFAATVWMKVDRRKHSSLTGS